MGAGQSRDDWRDEFYSDEYRIVRSGPSKGLANPPRANNCFLNVVIQTLFALPAFREAFLKVESHRCATAASDRPDGPAGAAGIDGDRNNDGDAAAPVAEACMYCAVMQLMAEYDHSGERVVSPAVLRATLASLFADEGRFQLGQQDDAVETLEALLDWLHSVTAGAGADAAQPANGGEGTSTGGAESELTAKMACAARPCLAHATFGLEVLERSECACGATSEPIAYEAFTYRIYVSEFRNMIQRNNDLAFDDILSLTYSEGVGRCPSRGEEACGRTPVTQHFLQGTLPQVFALVWNWDTAQAAKNDIQRLMQHVSLHIDLRRVFYGLDNCVRGTLDAVICYYGRHWVNFSRAPDGNGWLYFDDETVRRVGLSWNDVIAECVAGRLQVCTVFYSLAVEAQAVDPKFFHMGAYDPRVARDTVKDIYEALGGGQEGTISLEEFRRLQEEEMSAYAEQPGGAPPAAAAINGGGGGGDPGTVRGDTSGGDNDDDDDDDPDWLQLSGRTEFVFGPADFVNLPASRTFTALSPDLTWSLTLFERASGYLGVRLGRLDQAGGDVIISATISWVAYPFAFSSSLHHFNFLSDSEWVDPYFVDPERRRAFVANRMSISVSMTRFAKPSDEASLSASTRSADTSVLPRV